MNSNGHFLFLFCITVDVYPMYFNSGIFIWWSHDSHPTVPHYIIQFWHNETNNPTIFAGEAIGTTVPLSDYASSEDVEPHFIRINVTTNAHPDSAADSISIVDPNGQLNVPPNADGRVHNETITEVRVPGNVTGILIPNTKRIVVRILIPIDGIIDQDTRYVQWRAVSHHHASRIHNSIAANESDIIFSSAYAHTHTGSTRKRQSTCIRYMWQKRNLVAPHSTPPTSQLHACEYAIRI